MGERSLSRAAAASRARAFQTSIICAGLEPAGTARHQPHTQRENRINGSFPVKHNPCAHLSWSPAAGGREYTRSLNVWRTHSAATAIHQLPRVSSSREQEWANAPLALHLSLSPKREEPGQQVAVSENQPAHTDASLTSEVHQACSSIGEVAASRKLAGHITWRISNARTWNEVAAITHEFGGVPALNDIHLSAALARLAKLDVSNPLPSTQLPAQPNAPYSPHQRPQPSVPPTLPASRPQISQAPQPQQNVHNPLSSPLRSQTPNPQLDSHLRPQPYTPPNTPPQLGWPPSSLPAAPTPPRIPPPPPSLSRDHLAPPPPPPPTAPLQLTRWSHGAPYHSSPRPPGAGPLTSKPPGAPALGEDHLYQQSSSFHPPASINSPAVPEPMRQLSARGLVLGPVALTAGDAAAPCVPPGQRSGTNTARSESFCAISGMRTAAIRASSVDELFLELLDLLAERYGTVQAQASGEPGSVRRRLSTAAGVLLVPPPPPRVFANAVWAAARLLLKLRHRLMGDGGPQQWQQQQRQIGRVLEERDMHVRSLQEQVSLAAGMTVRAAAASSAAATAAAGLTDEANKAASRIDYQARTLDAAASADASVAAEAGGPALGAAAGVATGRSRTTSVATVNQQAIGGTVPKGWRYRRARTALVALLCRVPDVVSELEPQHTSSLLYTLAQLEQEAPDVLRELGAVTEGGGGGGRGTVTEGGGLVDMGSGEAGGSGTTTHMVTRWMVLALLESSLPKLETFGPQSLSNSLYAAARLAVSPPAAWMRAWRAAAGRQLSRADPQHIANMLWSCVRLGFQPGDEWVRAALKSAVLKAPAFTAEGLCITLWSISKLRPALDAPSDAAAVRRLLHALRAAAPGCGGQDVANGLYALAQLQILLCGPAPELHAQASWDSSFSEPKSNPPTAGQPTSQVPDAVVLDLESNPVSASAGVGSHGQSPSLGASITPSPRQQFRDATPRQHLQQQHQQHQQRLGDDEGMRGSTLFALRTTAQTLLQESSRHLHSYSAQQLANTAWAAATMGLAPSADWVAQFWPAALTLLPYMKAEELAATARAAVRLGLSPTSEWFHAVLSRTAHAMQLSADRPSGASAGDSGDDGGDGMGEERAAVAAGDAFQPTDRTLAALLWSVAAWRVRVPVAWIAAVLRQLEKMAAEGSLGALALASVMQSLARKRLNPDTIISGWTQRMVEGHVRSAGREYDDRAARMVLWSLARLRCRVSDEAAGALALRAAGCTGRRVAAEAVNRAGDACGMGGGSCTRHVSEHEGGDLAHDGCMEVPPTTKVGDDDGHSAGMVDLTRGAAGALPQVEEAVNVCLALCAVAMLECRPSRAVMREMVMRGVAVLPAATAHELVAMIRPLAALRFRPGPRFVGPFEDSIVRLGGAFDREQAFILLSCCSRLGLKLSTQALAAVGSTEVELYGRGVGQGLR